MGKGAIELLPLGGMLFETRFGLDFPSSVLARAGRLCTGKRSRNEPALPGRLGTRPG